MGGIKLEKTINNEKIYTNNLDSIFLLQENSAWDKFVSTGSVSDYLIYKFIKKNPHPKEISEVENQHGRISSI